MRKIVSKEDTDKKSRRKQLLVGGILIFIMLISTAGYSFSRFASNTGTNPQQITYKGLTFVNQNGLWSTLVNGGTFSFSSSPNEIINTNSNVLLTLSSYSGKPLYINSADLNSEYEIYRNLDSLILRRQYACLEGEKCTDSNFPVKTCDDNFIIIKESNSTRVSQNKSCVFIEGKKQDLVNITDGFLFKIIGIQ